jgi:hypothetical protein
MKTTKQIATITLITLLAGIAYGLFRTGMSTTTSQLAVGGANAAQGSAIDQTPLHTAQRLAQMSTSADELPLAQETLRLGDREMDLAFAAGVREFQEHPASLTAEAKESQTRLQDAENSLDLDNTRVARLSAALAKATGATADSLDDELQQAKVQVELDQDEVDNAKQELALAGGDTQGRIEELMKEHDAASRIADSTTVNIATPQKCMVWFTTTSNGRSCTIRHWNFGRPGKMQKRQPSPSPQSATLLNQASKPRNKRVREHLGAFGPESADDHMPSGLDRIGHLAHVCNPLL